MKNIMFISNGDKLKKQDIKNIKMEPFYIPCIKALEEKQYNIYAGINCDIDDILDKDGVHYFNQNVYRNIFALKDNWKAYKNINNIIKKYKIDIIHCNTPIGGVLGRICGRKNKVKTIIYTAHGFHFFRGNNPFKNAIYKTVEKYLARYTDVIITMNKEDYNNAKKFKLKNNGHVYLTHGIGISTDGNTNSKIDKNKKRRELGIKQKDIIIISSGDLIKRKNYTLSLDIIAKCKNRKIKYIICGNGPELDKLKKQAERLNIENQVLFLGFRKDIKELLAISDIFLFTTEQEGLPRSLMEAIASNCPCVISNIRGNIDLAKNKSYCFCCNTIEDYVKAINTIINNKEKFKNSILKDGNKIAPYLTNNIIKELKVIYKQSGL